MKDGGIEEMRTKETKKEKGNVSGPHCSKDSNDDNRLQKTRTEKTTADEMKMIPL